MRRAAGIVGLAAVVAWLGLRQPSTAADTAPQPPPLVVVATVGLDAHSTVLMLDGDGARTWGAVDHRAEAGLRATAVPEQGLVLVAADVGNARDRSYGAALFRIE